MTPIQSAGKFAVARAGLLLSVVSLMFLAPAAQAGPQADRVGMASDHAAARSALARGADLGRERPDSTVSLAFVLPLTHHDELIDLLHRIYDPADPLFRHYLTPADFAARFGADPTDHDAVRAFAEGAGLTVTYDSPSRGLVVASGPAAVVERAFNVRFERVRTPDGRAAYVNDRAPRVPESVAACVTGILGFDSLVVRRHHHRIVDSAAGQVLGAAAGGPLPLSGTGPSGGLAPSDITTAYRMGPGQDGTGQAGAVLELDGYAPSDITAYTTQFGLGAPSVQNVLVNGFDGHPVSTGGQIEVTLDIQLMLAVAPKLQTLYVYETANSLAGMLALMDRMASDDLASAISSSWGIGEDFVSASEASAENQALAQMAAQGQTFCVASGDSGAYGDAPENPSSPSLVVGDPAGQPFALGVGGTVLTTGGAGGAYQSEHVWQGTLAAAPNNGGGSGGGVSIIWSKPSYQAGGDREASGLPDLGR